MTKLLLDAPAIMNVRVRVTTYQRGRKFTTNEQGRGRMPSARRDYEDGILNATYNAVYKHVVKPKGKSDPKLELLSWDVEYPVAVTSKGIRIETVKRKDGRTQTVGRDRKGRFTELPKGRKLTDDEVRGAF